MTRSRMLTVTSLAMLVFVGCRPMAPSADSRVKVIQGKPSNIEIVGKISKESWVGGLTECTGTLIAPNMVLTAAHCVMKPYCETTECGFHTGDMTGQYFHTEGQSVPVKYGWSMGASLGNTDIGLLLLKRDVKVENFRLRYDVRLASHFDPDGGNFLIGYGCTGTTKKPGEYAEPQRETAGERRYASIDNGFYQSCPGDSGGPLATIKFVGNTGRQVSLFGVVSTWITTVSDDERPNSSTKPDAGLVMNYQNWILDRAREYGSRWPVGSGLFDSTVAPTTPTAPRPPQPTAPVVTAPSKGCVTNSELISIVECRMGDSPLSRSQCAALIARRDQFGVCRR